MPTSLERIVKQQEKEKAEKKSGKELNNNNKTKVYQTTRHSNTYQFSQTPFSETLHKTENLYESGNNINGKMDTEISILAQLKKQSFFNFVPFNMSINKKRIEGYANCDLDVAREIFGSKTKTRGKNGNTKPTFTSTS